MDAELLELQRQFEFAQQAKSSIRLSERNVVELVQKLQQLQIIDFDLLHTVTGKEYITPEQLKNEMVAEVKKLGRASLIHLADTTGVDLYHVENQAQHIVSSDSSLMLINGEIISSFYWDTAAEEINERLQECSQISIAEIAAQLQVGSELVLSMLEPRLGTLVRGRLEGGQLYTPAYVTRVNAMVRGAARGISVPMNLSSLWSSLHVLLQEMNGVNGVAVDGSFLQSLFNGLLKEGEILGSLRAGVHWTPTVFALAQKEYVDSFFSQNTFISYQALLKLGIPQPVQFLQSRYPEGIPLATIFAHPSLTEMLDAAVDDALEHNSWVNALSVLPSSFGLQDASKILSLCTSVQGALKSNSALILGDSYILSCGFVKDLHARLEKEMDLNLSGGVGALPFDLHGSKDAKIIHDTSSGTGEANAENDDGKSKPSFDKGSKRKKGKSAGSSKTGSTEGTSDNQESIPAKSKRNQKKGKGTSSIQGSDSRPGSKKDEDGQIIIPEEWLSEKITALVPDFEEEGDSRETIVLSLANHLRPLLLRTWKEKRQAAFTENAQRLKHLRDNLQRKLDESFLNIQLYEKALDIFEDDQPTLVLLHKHLLRSIAATMVDALLVNLDVQNKLQNGIEVEDSQNPESLSLSPGDRTTIAKSLQGPLSSSALLLIEALEGKQVETFMAALQAVADESGFILKKLDKKLERTLLHSYRKDLTSQVSSETDPVLLLPKVVSLLFVQTYGRALQAPGRAISAAVSKLKNKLDDSAFKMLVEYQSSTLTLIALMSAATGNEEDCTSDRTLSKREHLQEMVPALKSMVLGSQKSI